MQIHFAQSNEIFRCTVDVVYQIQYYNKKFVKKILFFVSFHIRLAVPDVVEQGQLLQLTMPGLC